jgi:nitric-oxide synthase, bacterial
MARCPITAAESFSWESGPPAEAPLADDIEEFLLTPQLGGDRRARLAEVRAEIAATGTYRQTFVEIAYGARWAWRNNSRCVGRAVIGQDLWRTPLTVVDRRSCRTPRAVAAALVEHLANAMDPDGRIRPMISVFEGGPGGWRIWNEQLIRYAGWRQSDGSVLGDPRNIELTEATLAVGWPGPRQRGRFDVLPLVVSGNGFAPEWFEVPASAVREVELTHPRYEWFARLGLRWHALPVISNMRLEIGAISYACAFNGWYVDSEIGARNLSDASRYALLRLVAEAMGLDMRDREDYEPRAMMELMTAVRHSFAAAGITIVPHSRVERQFVTWADRERAAGRSVPANVLWLISPLAASSGSVFHAAMTDPAQWVAEDPPPNFYYQAPPWAAPERVRAGKDDDGGG